MNRPDPRSLMRADSRALRPREHPNVRCRLRHSYAVLGLLALQAHAAGGNHAVDDAVMLEPGQCQIESWFDREKGGGRTLLHGGPACRAGPVELGLNADRVRLAGAGSTASAGVQLKWARTLNDSLSAGIVLSATWQNASPGFAGGTVLFPVTWQASETLLAHLNLGRDFRAGAPDSSHSGASLEWAPLPAWSFVAERFRESSTNFWRGGARYALSSNLSVDLSRARGLGGSAPAWWSLGLNWAFER